MSTLCYFFYLLSSFFTLVILSGCIVRKNASEIIHTDSTMQNLSVSHSLRESLDTSVIIREFIQSTQDSVIIHAYEFARPVSLAEIKNHSAPVKNYIQSIKTSLKKTQKKDTENTQKTQRESKRDSLHIEKKGLTQIMKKKETQRTPSYSWIIYTSIGVGLFLIIVLRFKKYIKIFI